MCIYSWRRSTHPVRTEGTHLTHLTYLQPYTCSTCPSPVFYFSRFHLISLDKTLSDNLKGTVIVEHPIFHVVLDPQDRYPLVGTPLKVRESKVKINPGNKNNQTDGESSEKKPKLTFFDVSDGELSEED